MANQKPELTALQRYAIEQARELITSTPQDIYAAEFPGGDILYGQPYAYAWGRLRPYVEELLEIIAELTGGAS